MIEFLSYYSGAFRLSLILLFVGSLIASGLICMSMEIDSSLKIKDWGKILIIFGLILNMIFFMAVDDEVRHYTESHTVCK